ncbi:hypothetical protein K445DRAFT_250377 [Daldinia sp. EC12]|nr:hypothetical protein K445DRAFT_250377 [Daldinia sp. EC12]
MCKVGRPYVVYVSSTSASCNPCGEMLAIVQHHLSYSLALQVKIKRLEQYNTMNS